MEAHLCSDLFEGSGLEVGGAHPGLEGAERVFDGRAADAHALRRAVQPVLHGVDYGLMLPALDPASYPFSILKLSGISSHVAMSCFSSNSAAVTFPGGTPAASCRG